MAMLRSPPALALLALVPALLLMVSADEVTHRYADGERVVLWFNEIGPYNNPQETYQFFDLPFCKPKGFREVAKREGLGEVLEGEDLTDSNLAVQFAKAHPRSMICDLVLEQDVADVFRDAVKDSYWYQVYLDDLPQWAMVGEWAKDPPTPDEQTIIFTHQRYEIGYRGGQILMMNLTSEDPQPITVGSTLHFSYSVIWKEMQGIEFEDRFRRYLDFDFFESKIHWFSIVNSFMMVIVLVGVVALILMRTLSADYAKYSRVAHDDDFDLDRGSMDDSGWKQVHGDVFRPPPVLTLLCAAVGNGLQLALLVSICILLAIMEHVYTRRGTTVTIFVVFYALTSFLGGFTSGSLYSRYSGPNWIKTSEHCPPPCAPLCWISSDVVYPVQ